MDKEVMKGKTGRKPPYLHIHSISSCAPLCSSAIAPRDSASAIGREVGPAAGQPKRSQNPEGIVNGEYKS